LPTVTKITEQKRAANRRSVYLDGSFAFGCNLNVVARFRLHEGMTVSPEQIEQIQRGELRQECLDSAFRSIESRMHSRAELKRKLMKKEWGETVVEGVLEDLTRLGYIDDAKFATAKAMSAANLKHHGPRRALGELLRAGVKSETAKKSLAAVYGKSDSTAVATALAERQVNRLKKLDPAVAKRRLIGMLQRRGFDYDTIKPVVDRILGR
jgi:regulatory protein